MRYRLRTLLILLAILPPILGVIYVRWQQYQEQERQRQRLLIMFREEAWAYDTTAVFQAIRQLSPPAPPPPADNSNQDTARLIPDAPPEIAN